MKRILLPLILLPGLVLAGHAQLLTDTPVQSGEGTCLILIAGEIDLTGVHTASSSFIDLTDVWLESRTPVGNLRLHGENRLAVPQAANLYLRDGSSYLENDLRLSGALDESGGVLRSSNGSLLRKEVAVSAQTLTETGLGFGLQAERNQTMDLSLHLEPRILELDVSTPLRAAVFETYAERLPLHKPHLFYSIYGTDNWKPADESLCEAAGEKVRLQAGFMPKVEALAAFEEPTIYFPAAITPNGDGINDRFEIPTAKNYPDSRLVVLSASGKTVFDQSPYLNDFDGTNLEAGTYYYLFYKDKNGKPFKRATLTILR